MRTRATRVAAALALLLIACGSGADEPVGRGFQPAMQAASQPDETRPATTDPAATAPAAPPAVAPPPPGPGLVACTQGAQQSCNAAWATCGCALNERGDVARVEADFDGDGAIDLRLTHVYDDAGNKLRWEHDRGADGEIDLVCTFTPPCPPPHPNDSCHCYGPTRAISADEARARIEAAGDRAERLDPGEVAPILEATRRAE